ncbi:MAG: hypothetical protein PHI12_12835 [Dehalococcoidales bacterium]|nr:hypothetical protein [Dehalococcoidales bacterium]
MVVKTAPPQVLTMEEYRRDWEPRGWQLIIIGPTSTWRQDWGEWEAIRDIVQNALDESERYTWGYDEEGLYIRDEGKGVAVADFLLGPPKLKPDWARGKYGEGMKIAGLALTRMGYSVRVETMGREIWIIFLEQPVNGRAETLAALWRPDGQKSGTTFHIVGYTGTAFEDRFAVNIPRSSVITEGPSLLSRPVQRYNQIIQHHFPETPPTGWHEKGAGASRIFARDIFLKSIRSPYSYNLWSFELAPDRHGPRNEDDLWVDVGRLWCCVTSVDHLRVFLNMTHDPPLLEAEENHRVNMSSYEMGVDPVSGKQYDLIMKENAEAWRAAWRETFGNDAVLRCNPRWDSTVKHLGYKSVDMQNMVTWALRGVITSDERLVGDSQERLREVEVIPDSKLDPLQLKHLALAREITRRVVSTPPDVHAAIIPPASDRVRTAGLYSRTTREVYVSLFQLDHARTTIDTLIHELGHHQSGAEDLEPGHADAMTKIASRVVSATAERWFDDDLEGITW